MIPIGLYLIWLQLKPIELRLWVNFLSSMKQSIGSKQTSLSWIMPFSVMVDLFAASSSIQKTWTLFVFKDLSEELLSSLIDK